MRVRNERGVVFLEAAYTIPILLAVLALIVTAGFALYNWTVIQDAARDAARHEALGLGDAQSKAQSELDGMLVGQLQNIQVSRTSEYVRVDIWHESPSFLPGIGVLFGGSPWKLEVPLHVRSEFKREQ